MVKESFCGSIRNVQLSEPQGQTLEEPAQRSMLEAKSACASVPQHEEIGCVEAVIEEGFRDKDRTRQANRYRPEKLIRFDNQLFRDREDLLEDRASISHFAGPEEALMACELPRVREGTRTEAEQPLWDDSGLHRAV